MEQDIRNALDGWEAQAPAADVVKARLGNQIRHVQRRRALLISAAGVATVGGTRGYLLRPQSTSGFRLPPAAAPGSVLQPPARDPGPAAGNTLTRLRYRPTWLPNGFVETLRAVELTGDQPRLQKRQWQGPIDPAIHNPGMIAPAVSVAVVGELWATPHLFVRYSTNISWCGSPIT